MFCNKCGTQLPDESAFCNKCGNKIEIAQPEQQTEIPKKDNEKSKKKQNVEEMTPKEINEFAAAKSKKAKILVIIGIVIGIISLLPYRYFISDNVTVNVIVHIMPRLSGFSALFLYFAFDNITKIPKKYRTKSQRVFTIIGYIIGLIMIVYAISTFF